MTWFGQLLLASLLLVGCSGGEVDAPVKPKKNQPVMAGPVETITAFDFTGAGILDVKTLRYKYVSNERGKYVEYTLPEPNITIDGKKWRDVIGDEAGVIFHNTSRGSKELRFLKAGIYVEVGLLGSWKIVVDTKVQPGEILFDKENAEVLVKRGDRQKESVWSCDHRKSVLEFYARIRSSSIDDYYPSVRFSLTGQSPQAERDSAAIQGMIDNLQLALEAGNYSPFGDSNARFQGRRFWDTDVWWFPAATFLNDWRAKDIVEHRLLKSDGAAKNFVKWKADNYPTANKTFHQPLSELVAIAGETKPLMFPWEADREGNEASPSDTVYEHHVTGDVALMLHQAILLDFVDAKKAEEVIKGCGAFYLNRLAKNTDGSYGILNVVSPSEWHTVSNDLYTNAIADWTIRRAFGEKAWPKGKIRLPKRKETYATFDGDDYDEYQQAAALLTLFPLQYEAIEQDADRMYEFYRGKAANFGPAMSSAVHSVIASQLNRKEDAYADWLQSWQPYTQNTAAEFREKPLKGESYFITGAAGSINAVIYGFMGFRIHDHKPISYDCMIPLKNGGWLTIKPSIPEEWGEVKFHSYVLGKRVIVVADSKKFAVEVDNKLYFDSKKPE